MSYQPERRQKRSDDELRSQRETWKRQWAARQQHHHQGTAPPTAADILENTIARRAYELYEKRGREHGRDLDDWLQAKRELQAARHSTAA
jgi:hypothetical protein